MIKTILFSGVVVALLSFQCYAHSLTTKQALIDSFDHFVAESEPGCALVYGNGTSEVFHSKGILEQGKSRRISATTPFLTASISKHFTAHLALILANKNNLSLKGGIQQYYPKFDSDKKITIRQLMNHTSGIPDHWSIFELQGRKLTETYLQEDALSLLENNLKLEFTPGKYFKYSNGGYLALTNAIENVSSLKLNELLHKYVNTKLGINTWYIDSPELLPKTYAIGHIKKTTEFKPYPFQSYIYGPANLMITAADFSKWAKYLNQQLLSMPEYVDAIATSANHNNYFAGLFIDKDNSGRQLLQHDGYYEHNTQSIVLLPNTEEYAIALCNRADFRPGKIIHNFLAKIGSLKFENTQEHPVTKSSHTLLSGFYINEEKNDGMVITAEGTALHYYGKFVGAPKLLQLTKSNNWNIQLSTSKVALERLDDSTVKVSNRQNSQIYQRFDENKEQVFKAISQQTYFSPTFGDIHFSFARHGRLDFINSVGEVSLQCSTQNYCWSEEGYVVVNIVSSKEILISTNDLKNISFFKR